MTQASAPPFCGMGFTQVSVAIVLALGALGANLSGYVNFKAALACWGFAATLLIAIPIRKYWDFILLIGFRSPFYVRMPMPNVFHRAICVPGTEQDNPQQWVFFTSGKPGVREIRLRKGLRALRFIKPY